MRRRSSRVRCAVRRAAWLATDGILPRAWTLQCKVHCSEDLLRKFRITVPSLCPRPYRSVALVLPLLAAGIAPHTATAGGLLGLDHVVTLDDSGIWARKYQLWLLDSMLAADVGAGLWEGETPASATPSGNPSMPP